jgi:nitroreductase
MTIDPVNEAIRSRRVVRNMSEKPLPPGEIELIQRSAHFAPNAGNRRIQKLVVVDDPGMLRLLRLISPGMLPAPRAAIVICIDLDRAERFGMTERTPGLYIDVGTLASTIMLAAYGRGIGSCPVTSFSRTAAARLLGLPDRVLPWMMVCFGYPEADQPAAFTVR